MKCKPPIYKVEVNQAADVQAHTRPSIKGGPPTYEVIKRKLSDKLDSIRSEKLPRNRSEKLPSKRPRPPFKPSSMARHASAKTQGKMHAAHTQAMSSAEFDIQLKKMLSDSNTNMRVQMRLTALEGIIRRIKEDRDGWSTAKKTHVKKLILSIAESLPSQKVSVFDMLVRYSDTRTASSALWIKDVIDRVPTLRPFEQDRIYIALGKNIEEIPENHRMCVLRNFERVLSTLRPVSQGHGLWHMARGLARFADREMVSDEEFALIADYLFETSSMLPDDARASILTNLVQHLGKPTPDSISLASRVVEELAKLPNEHRREGYLAFAGHIECLLMPYLADVIKNVKPILLALEPAERYDALCHMGQSLRHFANNDRRSEGECRQLAEFFFASASTLSTSQKVALFEAMAQPSDIPVANMGPIFSALIGAMKQLPEDTTDPLYVAIAAHMGEVSPDDVMTVTNAISRVILNIDNKKMGEILLEMTYGIKNCENENIVNFTKSIIEQSEQIESSNERHKILSKLFEVAEIERADADPQRVKFLEPAIKLVDEATRKIEERQR